MHLARRLEEIKSTLHGEEGAAEIRAAARHLEGDVPIAEILGAAVDPRFPQVAVAASRGCGDGQDRAWLTLAAGGPRRTCQVLAWRASQLLDPTALAKIAFLRRGARSRAFRCHIEAASVPETAAAWQLLASLRGSELRALVRARPALADAHRRGSVSRPTRGAGLSCAPTAP